LSLNAPRRTPAHSRGGCATWWSHLPPATRGTHQWRRIIPPLPNRC
jgi:hypothetical protein